MGGGPLSVPIIVRHTNKKDPKGYADLENYHMIWGVGLYSFRVYSVKVLGAFRLSISGLYSVESNHCQKDLQSRKPLQKRPSFKILVQDIETIYRSRYLPLLD